MLNLQTRYLQLDLKNPIIVASSGLTKSVEKIIACEEAGAAAVVVKSLFEETLIQEEWGASGHPEVYEYLEAELGKQYGPRDYCALLEAAKKKVSIPVIASINCVSDKWWPDYARQMEASGADALELNVYTLPTDPAQRPGQADQIYLDILSAVKAKVKIPVALKVGHYFSNLTHLASSLSAAGLDGLVLFNRFADLDMDVEKMQLQTTFTFSHDQEYYEALRWIALLSGKVPCDFAATTGIHRGTDVIKMLLAGARAVQIASAIYQNGVGQIATILGEIEAWMKRHNCTQLSDSIGRLSFVNSQTPEIYLRSQFMEKIRGWE